MGDKGEKPGYFDGLSKAFFNDVPYSTALTRAEQQLREDVRGNETARKQLVELKDIEAGQHDAAFHSKRLVQETERSREVSEKMIAPLLRDLGQGNAGIQDRLNELQTAFSEGTQLLSSTMSGVGDQISGVPKQSKSLEELLASGTVDEAETAILAASRILDRAQAEKFFRSLPSWKIDVIRSGLVTNVDPRAEKALTTQQKVFLAQLRRKTSSNPADFRSLSVFARQGLLDVEVHHALAERIPAVRFGVEGVKYEVRDLSGKASVLVEQGDEMLRRSDVQIGQGREMIAIGAVGITQREMALRLMDAGILKTEELVGVAKDSLSVQRASLRTEEAMLGGIANLGDLAVRAEVDRGAIVQNTGDTARNTAAMVDLAQTATVDRRAIRDGIGDLAETARHYGSLQAAQMDEARDTRLAQLDTARHYGLLQATQMNEAQETRLAQLNLTHALLKIEAANSDILAGIFEQIGDLTEVGERQLGELVGINVGLDILREIGIAQLETSERIVDALGDLRQTLALGVVNIVQIIDTVKQTLVDMEGRAVDREQSSERNLAQQSFQKAMAMLKIGKIDKAIKFFDESEERWPADFRVYFQRGLCYVLKNDARKAESDFTDAIKLASEDGEQRTRALIRLNLARLYYGEAKVHFENGRQPDYEEKLLQSIEEARRAVDEDPKFLEAQFGLATYLVAFKLFDEALEILIKIIPENPDFIEKLDHFDVFTPLRGALKNTLGEDFAAHENVRVSRVNFSIAKDCMDMGDFETAKKCLTFLFEKDPAYLRQSRIWELPEFSVIGDDIAGMVRTFCNFAEQHESEWSYAVIGIALHFPKIGRGAIYKAFKIAVEKDYDFGDKNSEKIRGKLEIFADDKIDLLIGIIKTKNPRDLPEWLIKSL